MKYLEKHPLLVIVIGVIGISMSGILVRYSQAPSAVTAAYRLLWTVLLMTPVVLGKSVHRRELCAVKHRTALLCCVSGVALAFHFALWFESLYQTSVASSTAIVCTEVIWVALGYCFFMKGKIGVRAAAAIAVTVAGSLLIAFSDASTGGDGHLFGDILSLLAAIAVAIYTLIGKEVRKTTSTTIYTYLVYVSCSAVLVVMIFIQGESLTGYGMNSVIVGILLAFFSTILGHSIFSWCLRYLSPAFVSASKLCEPVVASVFAAFLFDEIPAALQVVGGVIILGGVIGYSRIEEEESVS